MQFARSREDVAGGPDRLVRFLRVLDLAGVLTGRRVHVFRAVQLCGLRAGRGDRHSDSVVESVRI